MFGDLWRSPLGLQLPPPAPRCQRLLLVLIIPSISFISFPLFCFFSSALVFNESLRSEAWEFNATLDRTTCVTVFRQLSAKISASDSALALSILMCGERWCRVQVVILVFVLGGKREEVGRGVSVQDLIPALRYFVPAQQLGGAHVAAPRSDPTFLHAPDTPP